MLQSDSILLGSMPQCDLLLMNDSRYPWFVLVPRREGLQELVDMSSEDQQLLLSESGDLSRLLLDVFKADKLNVAMLGNIVPQLHIHHIARYRTDSTWPRPTWGVFEMTPYSEEELQERVQKARSHQWDNKVEWKI